MLENGQGQRKLVGRNYCKVPQPSVLNSGHCGGRHHICAYISPASVITGHQVLPDRTGKDSIKPKEDTRELFQDVKNYWDGLNIFFRAMQKIIQNRRAKEMQHHLTKLTIVFVELSDHHW